MLYSLVFDFISTAFHSPRPAPSFVVQTTVGLIENRNLYAACSGSIETFDHTPVVAAAREIKEETGLVPPYVKFIRRGNPYIINDKDLSKIWRIHPFLWQIRRYASEAESLGTRSIRRASKLKESKISERVSERHWPDEQEKLKSMIKLNWENTDIVFVKPEELEGMEAKMVPNLMSGIARIVTGHQIRAPPRRERQALKGRVGTKGRGRQSTLS